MKRIIVTAGLLATAACGHDPTPARLEARADTVDRSAGLVANTTTSTTTTTARPARASRRTTTVPTVPRPTPAITAVSGDYLSGLLDRLAQCESGGNPRAVSRNGLYYGAFQFLLSTWRNLGGSGNPIEHDYATQKAIASKIPVSAWRTQFPACARKLGVA